MLHSIERGDTTNGRRRERDMQCVEEKRAENSKNMKLTNIDKTPPVPQQSPNRNLEATKYSRLATRRKADQQAATLNADQNKPPILNYI
jgi:hypothetical protein